MSIEVAVAGFLALSTSLLMVACLVLVRRVEQARRETRELLARPFEFWQARERNRLLWDAIRPKVSLDAFMSAGSIPAADPDKVDKVVQFKRPDTSIGH